MTRPPRFFCAAAARRRGDPLAGTAPFGLVWVLIEYPGGWPPNGFDGLDLEPGVKALVFSAAQAVRARILLIRRHGRRSPGGPWRWAVLRYGGSGGHRQRWGTWSQDEDLAGIVAALGAPGETGLPPAVLVCTHGLHDTCCAMRGRPAARALSERRPELVWESTHVGGDRFAANVVVLPDGIYYGGLDAASSVTAVEEHLADRVHADHLRGYTDLVPAQQVAVAAALQHLGPAGRHAWAVTATTRLGDLWHVQLAGRPPHPLTVEVEVRSARTPPRQLTCRGLAPSSAVVHEATSLRLG